MNYPELSVLIPAAGGSTRLGRAKQLVEHNGNPLILNAVNIANSLGPAEILVVTGADAELVERAVSLPSVRWVHNPDWPEGMGGSIAKGAAEICPESTGVMILLCDQWSIREQDLQTLAKNWQSSPDRIICAYADGVSMPPVIFPFPYFAQLRDMKGKQGARNLLKTQAESLTIVPIQNAVYDLDTQTHLDKLRSQGQVPE